MNVSSLLLKEWVGTRSDNFFLNGQQDVRLSDKRILQTLERRTTVEKILRSRIFLNLRLCKDIAICALIVQTRIQEAQKLNIFKQSNFGLYPNFIIVVFIQ